MPSEEALLARQKRLQPIIDGAVAGMTPFIPGISSSVFLNPDTTVVFRDLFIQWFCAAVQLDHNAYRALIKREVSKQFPGAPDEVLERVEAMYFLTQIRQLVTSVQIDFPMTLNQFLGNHGVDFAMNMFRFARALTTLCPFVNGFEDELEQGVGRNIQSVCEATNTLQESCKEITTREDEERALSSELAMLRTEVMQDMGCSQEMRSAAAVTDNGSRLLTATKESVQLYSHRISQLNEDAIHMQNQLDESMQQLSQLQSNLDEQKRILGQLVAGIIPDGEPPLQEVEDQRMHVEADKREVLRQRAEASHTLQDLDQRQAEVERLVLEAKGLLEVETEVSDLFPFLMQQLLDARSRCETIRQLRDQLELSSQQLQQRLEEQKLASDRVEHLNGHLAELRKTINETMARISEEKLGLLSQLVDLKAAHSDMFERKSQYTSEAKQLMTSIEEQTTTISNMSDLIAELEAIVSALEQRSVRLTERAKRTQELSSIAVSRIIQAAVRAYPPAPDSSVSQQFQQNRPK